MRAVQLSWKTWADLSAMMSVNEGNIVADIHDCYSDRCGENYPFIRELYTKLDGCLSSASV